MPPATSNTSRTPLPLPAALRWLQQIEFPRKLGFCDRLFGSRLARHGVQWVRTAPGPVWPLDLANPTHRWIVYGGYEGPALWNWLRARPSVVRTVVDSGANIGQTVLYFAALVPAARIWAYEPGSAARDWLQAGVAANNFTQVQVEPAGLGAVAGTARLASCGADDRHGSWNKVNAAEGEPIVLATLDGELARHGLAELDLWKLDMEGYELEALRGAASALAAGRIRAVYIEIAGEPGQACLEFLTARGYRAHTLTPAGRPVALSPRHAYDNVLCLAPGHPDLPA